jgi:hypothetical protein
MKRKLKWLAVVLVVLVVGPGLALLLWPRDRITVDSWKQIRIGMTEKEVEEVMDGPGVSEEEFTAYILDLEKDGNFRALEIVGQEPKGILGVEDRKYWIGGRGYFQIDFNPPDHVFLKTFYRFRSPDPNLLDRLRNWLGW